MPPSCSDSRRWLTLLSGSRVSGLISGLAHRHDDERHVERQRHESEQDGGAARPGAALGDLFRRHGGRFTRCVHQCCTPRATISRDGGSVQLWYGGGDVSCHSRPRAPSQTSLVAFWPPFTHFQMMYGNSSCERPKPNAPSEDTMFQSVNCVE